MERKPYGFLQGPNGDYSNSRLIANFMIVSSVIFAAAFVVIAVMWPLVNLVTLATAIGIVITSLGGSAMIFLFGQKRSENKAMADVQAIEDTNTITPNP